MTTDELDLVPTDELLAALGRRYDGYVLACCKKMTAGESERDLWFGGGLMNALGLTVYARHKLLLVMEGKE